MGWRCLFGHQWKEKSKAHRRIYTDISDPSTYQYGETHYLFICTRCGEIKHLNFTCLFEYHDNPDEQDDDDRDAPVPKMSPDDFYDSLNNSDSMS